MGVKDQIYEVVSEWEDGRCVDMTYAGVDLGTFLEMEKYGRPYRIVLYTPLGYYVYRYTEE